MEETFPSILVVVGIIFWFWAIIDVVRSRFINSANRTIWLVVVLVFPIIGSLLYIVKRKSLVNPNKREFRPDFEGKEEDDTHS